MTSIFTTTTVGRWYTNDISLLLNSQWVPEPWESQGEIDLRAAEEDHRDESLGTGKAESTPGHHPHPVVDALHGSVGEPAVDVGEDTVAILSNRPSDPNEGSEPRSARPAEPFLQSPPCASGLLVSEQVSKGLLQQVGAVERALGALHFADLRPVVGREVPLLAQQREAYPLDRPPALGLLLGRTSNTTPRCRPRPLR